MAHTHFACPHCDASVPIALDDLMAAFAVPTCPGCDRHVYLIAGKLSNYQPGGRENEPAGPSDTYDPGE